MDFEHPSSGSSLCYGLWVVPLDWISAPHLYKVRQKLLAEAHCLNVLGLDVGERRDYRLGEYALRKAVILFARRNYLALVARQSKVADAVLVGTISFAKDKKQLVKTYSEGLNLVAPTVTLDLMEPSPKAAGVAVKSNGPNNGR
jgi:hypothetical protein